MFKLLPILLTTATINCVPFFEGTNQSTYDENSNDALTNLLTIDEQTNEVTFANLPHEKKDDVASTYGPSDPFEENALMDSLDTSFDNDKDNIADVCSSSLNNDKILRRQTCNEEKKPSNHEPEKPSRKHTMYPKLIEPNQVEPPSDPPCVNFPSRSMYLSCGGPEGFRAEMDKAYDSFVVYNCIEGMTFSCLHVA